MARILLLGPDRQRAAGLRALIARDGHGITWLRSIRNWVARESEIEPDVVVAAIAPTDGLFPKEDRPVRTFAPPLLLVRQEGDFIHEPYLSGRLVDCLASPFMSDELLARIDALALVRQIVRHGGAPAETATNDERRSLRNRLSAWVKNKMPERERPSGPYLEVAARVAEWSDRRDAFQPGHAGRVTGFCAMIAEGLGLKEHETAELLRAAMLHDIGKVCLPVEMLHQRQPLAAEQRRLIRTHPARGATLLRALDPDEGVARAVLYHHERPDGNGYYGKEAVGVPRAAFAIAVAETYDAMRNSLRGEIMDRETALSILKSGSGEAFDADCVAALTDALRPRATIIPLSRV